MKSVRIRSYIRFNLVSIGQAVGTAKNINYRKNFCQGFVVETKPFHGGAVRVYSVSTVVSD